MNKDLQKQKIEQAEETNELIIQHNNLIEARYHLTLQEKRLMCWLAAQVKKEDEDFKEHTLSIREFADLIDIKGDHLYKTLDDITTRLMRKIITIKEIDKQDFTKAALLGGAKYQSKKGLLTLSFHPYLKPYMLQLNERFTKISLGDVLGLRSFYSIRIYEITKQHEIIGLRKINIEDLRDFLGIKNNQYLKYNNFKKDVLERAKLEINKKTDLDIDYSEIKESRKVVSIEWTIKKKKSQTVDAQRLAKASKEYRSELAVIDALIDYGFSKPIARRMVQSNGEEVARNAMKAVDLQIARGHVKNPKAMLRVAIQEQWHPEKFKMKRKAA